jgi:hypothetical protein
LFTPISIIETPLLSRDLHFEAIEECSMFEVRSVLNGKLKIESRIKLFPSVPPLVKYICSGKQLTNFEISSLALNKISRAK